MKKALRAVFYFAGLVILSLGIILNTKSAFGVTPIISVAYCLSLIHNWNFGNASFVLYCVLAAMIGVGRFMWIYNRLFKNTQLRLTGVPA